MTHRLVFSLSQSCWLVDIEVKIPELSIGFSKNKTDSQEDYLFFLDPETNMETRKSELLGTENHFQSIYQKPMKNMTNSSFNERKCGLYF